MSCKFITYTFCNAQKITNRGNIFENEGSNIAVLYIVVLERLNDKIVEKEERRRMCCTRKIIESDTSQ